MNVELKLNIEHGHDLKIKINLPNSWFIIVLTSSNIYQLFQSWSTELH